MSISLKSRLQQGVIEDVSMALLYKEIKEEVEAILNHCSLVVSSTYKIQEHFESLLTYGLPSDFDNVSLKSLRDTDYLQKVACIISKQEPRLKNCHLSILDMEKAPYAALLIEGEISYQNEMMPWQSVAYCQPINRRYTLL